MKKVEKDVGAGIWALPSFPVVLVTVGRNIMTAAAFHFYSFEPPCVMVGIMPDKYTYELLSRSKEFGINIPTTDHLELVRICGSVSGRAGDKYAKAGVTPRQGKVIGGFLIEECPVNIECVVVHEVGYRGSHQWFVGEIKAVHLDEAYKRDQALMFWAGEYRSVGKVLGQL
jgi:flavin reductase (DIM6/NTAB) family NADH-FMN oxidoreductase RutF